MLSCQALLQGTALQAADARERSGCQPHMNMQRCKPAAVHLATGVYRLSDAVDVGSREDVKVLWGQLGCPGVKDLHDLSPSVCLRPHAWCEAPQHVSWKCNADCPWTPHKCSLSAHHRTHV